VTHFNRRVAQSEEVSTKQNTMTFHKPIAVLTVQQTMPQRRW